MNFHRERNTIQTSTPTTFVSRSAPQAHPIFLIKPIQYPTPNNPRLNQPATVIRPILSSHLNLPIPRPPFIRRLLRPAIIRPLPPRLVTTENAVNKTEPVTIQRRTPVRESSIESSLSTLSTISSNPPEIQTKKSCCYCLPCCRSKDEEPINKSSRLPPPPLPNSFNFRLKTRTIYLIISLLFLFFLIVIILLIVLIVVHR